SLSLHDALPILGSSFRSQINSTDSNTRFKYLIDVPFRHLRGHDFLLTSSHADVTKVTVALFNAAMDRILVESSKGRGVSSVSSRIGSSVQHKPIASQPSPRKRSATFRMYERASEVKRPCTISENIKRSMASRSCSSGMVDSMPNSANRAGYTADSV